MDQHLYWEPKRGDSRFAIISRNCFRLAERTAYAFRRPATRAHLPDADAAGISSSRREHGARAVVGRHASLAGDGWRADGWLGAFRAFVVAVGRARSSRYLGPQARRTSRISRPF